MSDHGHEKYETNARDGAITFLLSMGIWLGLLAVVLGFGHVLANQLAAHH